MMTLDSSKIFNGLQEIRSFFRAPGTSQRIQVMMQLLLCLFSFGCYTAVNKLSRNRFN